MTKGLEYRCSLGFIAIAWVFFFSSLLIPTGAESAEVVGVDEPASENPPEAEPAPRELPRNTRNSPRRAPENDSGEDFFQDIGVSGSIGFSGGFAANLSVSLGLNRYTAVNLSGFYQSYATDEQSEVRYGPEVDLVLQQL